MAQFASDAFTGTSGTELATYSAAWVKHASSGAGTIAISNANRCRHGADNEAFYYHTGSPAGTDYTVAVDIYPKTLGGNCGVIGRVDTGANTFYMARHDPATNVWQLYRRVAGTFSLLGSYSQTLSVDTTYVLLMSMSGSGATVSLEVKIDGVSRITYSDTDATRITSAGKSGLRSFMALASDTTLLHMDNFSADDIVAAGGVGPIIKHFRLINGGILMQSRLVIRSMLRWLRGGSFA